MKYSWFRKKKIERIVLRDIQAGDILLFRIKADHPLHPIVIERYAEQIRRILPPTVKVGFFTDDFDVDILRPPRADK